MSQETERIVEAAAAALCPDERYRQQAFDDARAATVAVLRELAEPISVYRATDLYRLADEIEEGTPNV